MTRQLKVALLQEIDHGSREANLDAIEAGLRDAASAGAQLVLLQELHNGPYLCQHEDVAEFDRAEPIPGPSSERLGALAADLKLVLVASLFERRAAGLYHNTALIFDRSAQIAGRYRKMHIPDDPGFYEKFYFTPGDLGFHPIDTSVGRLGVLVCWDQWYPEAARLMALAGAELLLYPTAIGWDPDDDDAEKQRQRDAWVTVQRGHAIANGLPLLACNRTGFEADPSSLSDSGRPGCESVCAAHISADSPAHRTTMGRRIVKNLFSHSQILASTTRVRQAASGHGRGIQFWGSSFVAGPQGEMLAQAGSDKPEIVMVDIDMQRSEQVRRIWPFLRDRRIDAYADLLKRFRD